MLVAVSIVTGCVSISYFDLLFGIPISTSNFVVELNICATTVSFKKCKSIIKKKEEKNLK